MASEDGRRCNSQGSLFGLDSQQLPYPSCGIETLIKKSESVQKSLSIPHVVFFHQIQKFTWSIISRYRDSMAKHG